MIALFPSRTIAVTIFGYSIHWYGVMYALAFWIAYALLPKLGRLRGVQASRDQWTMLVVYAALGVLVGGRLGYVLFYQPFFFLQHPEEVVAIWNGGMSSHGGFIGVALASWMWSSKHRVPYLRLLDVVTVPAALGLALGRLGNFINQELYVGYGAFLDIAAMVCIAVVCYAVGKKSNKDGISISLFILLYSISRFFLETIRVQEWSYIWGLTRGQLLTIPLALVGVVLFLYARKRNVSHSIQ